MTETTKKRKAPSASSASVSEGLRSLLVPIDLTPGSDRVLGRVALLPLADHARVTLLHVVPGGLLPVERQRAERDAKKALAEEARHLRKQLHGKISVEPMVAAGGAAKQIASVAAKVKAELIVMGRGGGRALRDTFLGSNAERVVREAQLPVLVVRLAARAEYSRPALALDLDDAAPDVVRVMLRVLRAARHRVEVIHAFDAPYQGMIYPSVSADAAEDRKDRLRADATLQLRKQLATALAKANVRPQDAPVWKTHVRYGSARTVVAKAIKRSDTDLLVLGTHGYSGTAYVFLGTVAGDVLREAHCDVLVVPPAPAEP